MWGGGGVHERRASVAYWRWWVRNIHIICYRWVQAYLGDVARSVSDHCKRANTATKWVTQIFFCFPVHIKVIFTLSSVQLSHSVMSDSLWPHGLQHARIPCPSPTPRVYSNSCPSNQGCHPTISSSVIPFSSHLQSFPGSGPFQMSQHFASCGQSTGVSALASVLPINTQDWSPFRMDWVDLLAVQGTLKSLLQHHTSKASIHWRSAFFPVQLSHPYTTTGKTIALTRRTFVGK